MRVFELVSFHVDEKRWKCSWISSVIGFERFEVHI